MKKVKEEFYCDRCGIKLAQNPLFFIHTSKGDVRIKKRYKVEIFSSKWNNLDLCKRCQESFAEWMKGFKE